MGMSQKHRAASQSCENIGGSTPSLTPETQSIDTFQPTIMQFHRDISGIDSESDFFVYTFHIETNQWPANPGRELSC